ncbi:MAG TPA: hypothetical protein VH305_07030 [Gaiella sp.]
MADAEVVVRLTGLDAFAALKRELRIPIAAIRAVSRARYDGDGLRVGGTSIPFTEIRAGRFRRGGKRTLVSFEHRDRVLTLTLDRRAAGVGYDVVAVGVDDPVSLAEQLESRGVVRLG